MKPREIIILLLAAAFGAIAIVTWSGEEEAKAQAKRLLHPDRLIVTVVGKPQGVK